MEAQLWTLIVLQTATILGLIFYVGGKLDTLEARLGARLDAFDRIENDESDTETLIREP